MGYYKDSVIDEVRDRTNIIDIIGEFLPLKKRGRNFIALCPFHGEKTPSFTVSPEKQIYRCFGCGASGNVYTFLMEYEHMTFNEALTYLADKVGVRLEREGGDYVSKEERSRRDEEKERLYTIHEYVARYFYKKLHDTYGEKAFLYAKNRGLSKDILDTFKVGYAPYYSDDLLEQLTKLGYTREEMLSSGIFGENDKGTMYSKFFNRLIFPIDNAQGRIIAFGGRSIDGKEPKYLNSQETPIFKKKNTLFNLKMAIPDIKKQNQVLVMEGYMDVISTWQKGVKNSVASLGTAFTENQGRLLSRYADEIILVYDSDTAGQKAALKSLETLRYNKGSVRVASIVGAKDPDEFISQFGLNAFLERMRQAKSSFRFLLDHLKSNNDYSEPEGRIKVIRGIQQEVMHTEDEMLREEYMRVLAEEMIMDFSVVKGHITGKAAKEDSVPRATREIPQKKKAVIDGRDEGTRKELLALRVLLNNLEYGILIPEDFKESMEDDLLKRTLDTVLNNASHSVSELIDVVADEEVKDVIIRLSMSEKIICPPVESEGEFLAYFKAIRKQSLTKKREQLKNEIVLANKEGNSLKCSELQKDWTILCKEISEL